MHKAIESTDGGFLIGNLTSFPTRPFLFTFDPSRNISLVEQATFFGKENHLGLYFLLCLRPYSGIAVKLHRHFDYGESAERIIERIIVFDRLAKLSDLRWNGIRNRIERSRKITMPPQMPNTVLRTVYHEAFLLVVPHDKRERR